MLIRPATQEDAKQCVDVMVRAMSESADYNFPKPDEIRDHWLERVSGYLAGSYHPGFALEERAIFVAEQSGEIIAFIAGHRTLRFGGEGELQWAFVSPEWQRKGIGSSLLSQLRRWFKGRNIKKVVVNAPTEMKTREFYLENGAVAMNQHWCVWEDISAKRQVLSVRR